MERSSRLCLSLRCCRQMSGLKTSRPGKLQLFSDSKCARGTAHGASQAQLYHPCYMLQHLWHKHSVRCPNHHPSHAAGLTILKHCCTADRPTETLLLGVSGYLLRPEPSLKREGCGDNANSEDAQGLSSCCYNRGGAATSSSSHTCLHCFRMQSGDGPINAAD